MATVSITDLTNAKLDTDHIADIATSLALTATDRLGTTKKTLQGAINSIAAIDVKGAWATTTAYVVKDAVLESGNWYICLEAHTSGTFATDLAAGKWSVLQGITDYNLKDYAVRKLDFVSDMKAMTNPQAGEIIMLKDYASGNGAGVMFFETKATTGTDDGGSVINHDTLAFRFEQIFGNTISVKQFGAVGDGITDDTATVSLAYTYSKSAGGLLEFPQGNFKGQFLFDGDSSVRGSGKRRTVLSPSNTTSYCVKLFGTGGNAGLGATLSNLSIESSAGTGKGLEIGDRASGGGGSNQSVSLLEIKGFEDNIFLGAAIMCRFSNIWSYEGTYGIRADSEANVTTCHFDSCRFFGNQEGGKFQAGHVMTFTNCDFESNFTRNLTLATGITSGPTKAIFNGCWFENLQETAAGEYYSIYLTQSPSIGTKKPMDAVFNNCVISTPASTGGALYYDLNAEYAQNVHFNSCSFTEYSSGKFKYSSGTNGVRVWLHNCGKVQELPSYTMYSAFPALTRVSGGVFGFHYDFNDASNKRWTNYENYTTTADLTSFQVAGLKTISVDSSSGGVNINSFIGGSDGQQINIIKPSSSNTVSVKHNGTGSEKFFLRNGADVSLSSMKGTTLVCKNDGVGTPVWYQTLEL